MVPFGALFTIAGARINEYGLKVITALLPDAPTGVVPGPFLIEHVLLSVAVAVPLVALARHEESTGRRLGIGVFYGLAFHVAVNSLLLPFAFDHPTPWQLGWAVILPSLVVHLVYGATVGILARESR